MNYYLMGKDEMMAIVDDGKIARALDSGWKIISTHPNHQEACDAYHQEARDAYDAYQAELASQNMVE